MKTIFLIFSLFFIFSCTAKKDIAKCSKPGFVLNDSLKHIRNTNIKLKTVQYSSAYVSGFVEGLNDVLSFHPDKFEALHPNVNKQFWLPQYSWKNKYKNGDPLQGEKFFGSTSFFVSTTDAWHALKTVNRFGNVSASLVIRIGEKKKITYYLKELLISYIFNRTGFYTSYNLIYK